MAQSSRYAIDATKSLVDEGKSEEMPIGPEPVLIPDSCQVQGAWPCHPHGL